MTYEKCDFVTCVIDRCGGFLQNRVGAGNNKLMDAWMLPARRVGSQSRNTILSTAVTFFIAKSSV